MNLTDMHQWSTLLYVMAASMGLGALLGFACELTQKLVAARPPRAAARAGGRIR
jgi:hypothetical protein